MMLLPAKSAMAVTPGLQQKAKVSVNVNKNTLNDQDNERSLVLSQQKAMLFQVKNVFKAICLPEVRVVNKLLCKFQFMNEDILRSQVINELASFTSKDKFSDQKLYNTLTNFNNVQYGVGQQSNILQMLSSSPQKQHYSSFENEWDMVDDSVMPKQKRNALSVLQNPGFFLSNNGIAYEVAHGHSTGVLSGKGQTSAAIVSREQIRRKLDVLLYNVSRRIKYIFSQSMELVSIEFAEALTN